MASTVTIYSTETCPFCKMAKEFFKNNGIAFAEKDVAADLEAQREMIEKSGQLAVPVIDINGQIVVGFNEARLKELLQI